MDPQPSTPTPIPTPKVELTIEQQRFINLIERGKADPVVFAQEILGIKLHDGQKKWLQTTISPDHKRNILVPGNSFGKTVVSAVKQLYYLFYKIGLEGDPEAVAIREYRTAHLAPHSEQIQQCYNYMVQILTNSFSVPGGKNNVCLITDILATYGAKPRAYIRLANNSTFLGFSTGDALGSSFQGAQFGLITFDECCREYHLEKVVTEDCLPRLIKHNGPIDLVSTPWTESPSLQYYYRICQKGLRGEDGWYTQQGGIDQNIFYDETRRNQLKSNMLATRPELYDQVVKGEFVFAGGREFRAEDIENIFKGSTGRWDPETPVIEAPRPEGQYVLAWDWAFATSKESAWSVFMVIDYSKMPWKIVYYYRTKGSDRTPEEQFEMIRQTTHAYSATFVVDGQSAAGSLVVDKLQELNPRPFMSASLGGKDSEKKVMILRLQQALTWSKGTWEDYGKLRCDKYIEPLASELGIYTRDDTKIEKDSVMALGMNVNYYEDADIKLPYVMMQASADT